MDKEITVAEFADELVRRIDETKSIDCCADEIKKLAALAKEKLGSDKIVVHWSN